jgi:hypothetical protein
MLRSKQLRIEGKRAATLKRHAAELARLNAEEKQVQVDIAEVEAHKFGVRQARAVRSVLYRVYARAWRKSLSPEEARQVEENVARALADGRIVIRDDGILFALGEAGPVLLPYNV